MCCDEMLDLLSASLDDELTDQQKAQLQAHLAQCPSCRALLAELAAIHDNRDALEAAAPPELTRRVLDALPAQAAKKSAKLLYWRRWGAMAAAVALIALAAWRMPWQQPGHSADLQPPEQAATGAADYPVPYNDVGQAAVNSDETDVGSPAAAAPALPPYVDGPAISANTGLAEPTANAGEVTMGADGDAGAAVKDKAATIAQEEAPPAGKTVSAAPRYFSYTAADTADSASLKEEDPEPAAGSAMVLSTFARSGSYGGDASADNAVAELPPAAGSGEESISVEPLEELYELTASAPEAAPVYRGVLILPQGTPVGDYPAQVQEDGQVWYTLPAADFNALRLELDSQGVSYQLRLEGADISPTAQQGLLIVTGQSST